MRRYTAEQVREINFPVEATVAGTKLNLTLSVPLSVDFLANLVQTLVDDGNEEIIKAVVEERERQGREGSLVATAGVEIGNASAGGRSRASRSRTSRRGQEWGDYGQDELEQALQGQAPAYSGRGPKSDERKRYDAAVAWDAAGRPDLG